jgi:hypothetical protein
MRKLKGKSVVDAAAVTAVPAAGRRITFTLTISDVEGGGVDVQAEFKPAINNTDRSPAIGIAAAVLEALRGVGGEPELVLPASGAAATEAASTPNTSKGGLK